MSKIQIDLPHDRTHLGELRLMADDNCVARFPCYGKADNAAAAAVGNPKRLTTLRNGDTPLGAYRVTGLHDMGDSPKQIRSYGALPAIGIEGIGGDALIAKQAGRTGLMIHGGTLSSAGLRPTHGCVRLSEASMAELHRLFAEHGNPSTVAIEEI